MQRLVTAIATAAIIVWTSPAFAATMSLDTTVTAFDLVQKLLGSAPGITVLPGSREVSGAAGIFFNAGDSLPFEEGITLATGNARTASQINLDDGASVDSGTGGDTQLSALIGGTPTTNAAVLEFAFTAVNPVVSFQYVFASEEYNEWVGTRFNDVFGFFLNDVNIALVPRTATKTVPVAVSAVNCSSNNQFYTNNDDPSPGDEADEKCAASGKAYANLPIQYDGLIGAGSNPEYWLHATGSVNTGGAVNTIKLAIADTSDHLYDSAVFLKAGSFQNAPPPVNTVPEPSSLGLLGLGVGLACRRRARRHNA